MPQCSIAVLHCRSAVAGPKCLFFFLSRTTQDGIVSRLLQIRSDNKIRAINSGHTGALARAVGSTGGPISWSTRGDPDHATNLSTKIMRFCDIASGCLWQGLFCSGRRKAVSARIRAERPNPPPCLPVLPVRPVCKTPRSLPGQTLPSFHEMVRLPICPAPSCPALRCPALRCPAPHGYRPSTIVHNNMLLLSYFRFDLAPSGICLERRILSWAVCPITEPHSFMWRLLRLVVTSTIHTRKGLGYCSPSTRHPGA